MNLAELIEKDNLLLTIYQIVKREGNKKTKIEEITKVLEGNKAFIKLLNFDCRERLGKLDIRINGFKDEDRSIEEIEEEIYLK